MAEKICAVCGKKYDGYRTSKYCSDRCKKIGTEKKMNEWRQRTGYNEIQKLKKRQQRAEQGAKQREYNRKNRTLELVTFSRINKDAVQRQEEKLKAAADSGDNLARMTLIMRNRQDFRWSKEYWMAFQDYIIEYYQSTTIRKNRDVNGVSIMDPEFPEKVIERIQHDGIIRINT